MKNIDILGHSMGAAFAHWTREDFFSMKTEQENKQPSSSLQSISSKASEQPSSQIHKNNNNNNNNNNNSQLKEKQKITLGSIHF